MTRLLPSFSTLTSGGVLKSFHISLMKPLPRNLTQPKVLPHQQASPSYVLSDKYKYIVHGSELSS